MAQVIYAAIPTSGVNGDFIEFPPFDTALGSLTQVRLRGDASFGPNDMTYFMQCHDPAVPRTITVDSRREWRFALFTGGFPTTETYTDVSEPYYTYSHNFLAFEPKPAAANCGESDQSWHEKLPMPADAYTAEVNIASNRFPLFEGPGTALCKLALGKDDIPPEDSNMTLMWCYTPANVPLTNMVVVYDYNPAGPWWTEKVRCAEV